MAPYRVVVTTPPAAKSGRGNNRSNTGGSNRNNTGGSNRNNMSGSNRNMSGSNRNVGAKRPVRDSTLVSTNHTNNTGNSKNSNGSKRQVQYQPVRSKRNLEPSAPSTPQLLPQAPIDGPWVRAKNEWKDPWSWFAIDDCGRLLDVPHTFGGSQTIYKWILWAIMMASLIYLWSTADNLWFLGDLDHWALLIATIYQTLSLGNGHIHPPQPATADEGVNLYVKIFWVLFEIAAHLELLTCVMFWAVVFPQDYENIDIDYGLFALHGLILVGVWVDGMVLNRIPVRVKHYFFVLAVDSVYVLWTGIHALAGWENGSYDEGESSQANSSDAIYIAFDWNNETAQSIFLMIAVLTVLAPLLYTFQYLMSLYSFPCIWNGSKSRKCIEFDMAPSMAARNSTLPRSSPTQGKGPGGRVGGTSPAPVAPVIKKPAAAKNNNSNDNNNNSNISETSRTSSRREGRPMSPVANVPLDTGARPLSPHQGRRSKRPSDTNTVASALTMPPDLEAPPPPKQKVSRPKSPFPIPIPGVAKKSTTKGAGRPKPKREMSVMDIA